MLGSNLGRSGDGKGGHGQSEDAEELHVEIDCYSCEKMKKMKKMRLLILIVILFLIDGTGLTFIYFSSSSFPSTIPLFSDHHHHTYSQHTDGPIASKALLLPLSGISTQNPHRLHFLPRSYR